MLVALCMYIHIWDLNLVLSVCSCTWAHSRWSRLVCKRRAQQATCSAKGKEALVSWDLVHCFRQKPLCHNLFFLMASTTDSHLLTSFWRQQLIPEATIICSIGSHTSVGSPSCAGNIFHWLPLGSCGCAWHCPVPWGSAWVLHLAFPQRENLERSCHQKGDLKKSSSSQWRKKSDLTDIWKSREKHQTLRVLISDVQRSPVSCSATAQSQGIKHLSAGEGKKESGKEISKRQLSRMDRGSDLGKPSQSVINSVNIHLFWSLIQTFPYSMWECLKIQLLTETGLSAEQVTIQYQHI